MKKIVNILLGCITLSVCSISANAQGILSTVAGSGMGGYGGDNGPATAANLYAPSGICLDVAHNLYIVDQYNNCIRKVDSTGNIITIAGNDTAGYSGDNFQATAAKLNNPNDVAVDIHGNVYIADKGNNCIRMVDPAGLIFTIAGTHVAGYSGDNGPATAAKLNGPNGIAVDENGNVFIADMNNNRVRKINADGIITTICGTGYGSYNGDNQPSATTTTLNQPTDVAVDQYGQVFIADRLNRRVRKLDTLNKVSTIYYKFNALPTSIAVDGNGYIYYSDEYFSYVLRFNSDGGQFRQIAGNATSGYTPDGGPATAAKLGDPKGVAVDAEGDVYISEWSNNMVRYVTSVLGASTVTNSNAQMQLSIYPNPAPAGNFTLSIAAADKEKATISVINVKGEKVFETVAETNKSININLNQPTGIYTVIADTQHGRLSNLIQLVAGH